MSRTAPFPRRTRSRATGVLVCGLICLGGCVAVAVGTVTVATVDIARDPRTYFDDNTVELKIRHALLRDALIDRDANLSVTAMNGIVLLTGEVPKAEQSNRAAAIAREFPEVRQVINQLSVGPPTPLSSRGQDSWITGKVKSSLVVASGVSAGEIKVLTENGTVYLMGLVRSEEADAAVDIARGIRGVTRIVKVFEYI